MQGKFNTKINGKLYGVLWRGYHGNRKREGYRNYKLAASPFAGADEDAISELKEVLESDERLASRFLNGEQIKF